MGLCELWLSTVLISHPAAQTKIKQICPFPPNMTSMLMLDSGAQAAQPSSLQPQASLPPEQQLGVVLALQIFVYEVGQELFEDISGVLQLALQHGHDQRGHITTVPHGEAALGLQRADEGQQENLVIDELGKELQAFLHTFLPIARDLHKKKGSLYLFLTTHCQTSPNGSHTLCHLSALIPPAPPTLHFDIKQKSVLRQGKRKSCFKQQRQLKKN